MHHSILSQKLYIIYILFFLKYFIKWIILIYLFLVWFQLIAFMWKLYMCMEIVCKCVVFLCVFLFFFLSKCVSFSRAHKIWLFCTSIFVIHSQFAEGIRTFLWKCINFASVFNKIRLADKRSNILHICRLFFYLN